MKIVCISDIHGKWNKVKEIPACDLLISTGDYSFRGESHMIKDYHSWLNKQDARCVISVQGNHEVQVQSNFQLAKEIAIKACPQVLHFMEEGLVEFEGVKIWCSPWTPWFHSWAYNAHRGPDIKRHWQLIPDDVNIIACHGPPAGILDEVRYADGTLQDSVGCQDLMNKINELRSKSNNLKLVCFGHIHGSSGMTKIDDVTYINASQCGESYQIDYEPYEFTLEV